MTFEFPRFPLPFIDALRQQPDMALVSVSKRDAPALERPRRRVIERGVDGARL
jgi:hypothetical protein